MLIVPPDQPAHIAKIGNPWSRWKRHKTSRLHRFDEAHESHEDCFVFRLGEWKLLISNQFVWDVSDEREWGSGMQRMFLVAGDRVFITNEPGRLMRIIEPGEADHAKFRAIFRKDKAKDPRDHRS